MDRLHAVGVLLLLAGCEGGERTPPPAPSRVDAVAAPPPKAVNTAGFCEARPNRTYAWPALDGAPAPALASSGWTWVNVWATWCAPCIEEMPRLAGWESKLTAEGAPVDVQFLSVDGGAAEVQKFYADHPDSPRGMRIQSLDLLSPWLTSLGLDDSAVLPLHLFVDPAGNLRCVRMGGLSDGDYATVKAVIQGK